VKVAAFGYGVRRAVNLQGGDRTSTRTVLVGKALPGRRRRGSKG
jgi:hypothetical protein